MEGAMRQGHYTVKRAEVQERTAVLLQEHLQLKDYGRKCTIALLWHILLAAAARVTSIYDMCQRLAGAPSDETVRRALLATLPSYAVLERQLNRALAAGLPQALRRRRQPLACDLVLIPYHGAPFRERREIYRSKPKGGTTHFHAYATAYVIRQGWRYTVALTPVSSGEAMEKVLQRLLQQAGRVGVKPRYLLLDRGFYSVNVIRYLQRARYPFLMPPKFPGRPPKHARRRAPFRDWNKSGWSTHTLTNAKKQSATIAICVACRNPRGQRKQHTRQRLIYAYWGLHPGSHQWVYQTYRRRFGIETSYRQLNQARIRTTSRRPLLRLLFVGLSLLLRNVWVWLHYHVLATPRRGARRINLHRLRFRALLHCLLHVAEQNLGHHDDVIAQLPLPPTITARAA
jgi:DDE family transposase